MNQDNAMLLNQQDFALLPQTNISYLIYIVVITDINMNRLKAILPSLYFLSIFHLGNPSSPSKP